MGITLITEKVLETFSFDLVFVFVFTKRIFDKALVFFLTTFSITTSHITILWHLNSVEISDHELLQISYVYTMVALSWRYHLSLGSFLAKEKCFTKFDMIYLRKFIDSFFRNYFEIFWLNWQVDSFHLLNSLTFLNL